MSGQGEVTCYAPELRKPLRMVMWALLLLMAPQSMWADSAGWLMLLLAALAMRTRRDEGTQLTWVATIGLLAATLRLALSLRYFQSQAWHALFLASMLLTVGFVWVLCNMVRSLAREVGGRSIERQTALRRWLYVLPAAFYAGNFAGIGSESGGSVLVVLFLVSSLMATTAVMSLLASTARACVIPAAAPVDEDDPQEVVQKDGNH
jgi:hypothetical protein